MRMVAGVVIAGASVATGALISELRAEGYDGRVIVIDQDPDAPYDRPPLSKEFLREKVQHPDAPWWDDRCEVIRGRATSLDPAERTITAQLDDDVVATLRGDQVVIATGAHPVRLPDQPEGVAELRTAADARVLREYAAPDRHVVILGAGTIGTELASSIVHAGGAATLIDMAQRPLDRFLGGHLAEVAANWIRGAGVMLHLCTRVERVERRAQDWCVLTDRGPITGDVVVSAIGTRPATGWLTGTGIALGNGVLCDVDGGVLDLDGGSIPGVHAIGDVAAWSRDGHEPRRHEDWTSAQRQGRHVARRILGLTPVASLEGSHDYFWTHQFGRRIQVLGSPERDAVLVEEVVDPDKNAAFYRLERDGETVAWISINRPREFALAMREAMAAPV